MARPAKKPAPTGKRASIYEAKTHFSALVERARAGEEIEITRNGEVVARLAPVEAVRPKRKLGDLAGKVRLAPDFDRWPDDIRAYRVGRVDDLTGKIET
jgi:prevent-host-death family protein